MTLNTIRRRILTGTLAASVLFGAAGWMQGSFASAKDSSANTSSSGSTGSTVTDKQRGYGHGPGFGRGGRHHKHGLGHKQHLSVLVETSAEVIGMEASELRTKLDEGQTLLDIAVENGLTKETYVQKLEAAIVAVIDGKLSAGELTAEQAEQWKAALSDKLPVMIEQASGDKLGWGMRGMKRFGTPEELAEAIGTTANELREELQAGKSIAEIAADNGLDREALIAELKELMTDELERFVGAKRPTASEQ